MTTWRNGVITEKETVEPLEPGRMRRLAHWMHSRKWPMLAWIVAAFTIASVALIGSMTDAWGTPATRFPVSLTGFVLAVSYWWFVFLNRSWQIPVDPHCGALLHYARQRWSELPKEARATFLPVMRVAYAAAQHADAAVVEERCALVNAAWKEHVRAARLNTTDDDMDAARRYVEAQRIANDATERARGDLAEIERRVTGV